MGSNCELWTKSFGRIKYDYKWTINEDTGEKKKKVMNLKKNTMWLSELPPECYEYILKLCGLQMTMYSWTSPYKVVSEIPIFSTINLLGELYILYPILKEWQKNNIVKTKFNSCMLNGHTNMKDVPKVSILFNTNEGDIVSKYFGELWEDFISENRKKKSDAYLRMSEKDNCKLFWQFLQYYVERKGIFREKNYNHVWKDVGRGDRMDYGYICEYVDKGDYLYENSEGKKIVNYNIDSMGKILGRIISNGWCDLRRSQYCNEKIQVFIPNKKNGYNCIRKDFPVLKLDDKDQIKLPLEMSKGWGFKYDFEKKCGTYLSPYVENPF